MVFPAGRDQISFVASQLSRFPAPRCCHGSSLWSLGQSQREMTFVGRSVFFFFLIKKNKGGGSLRSDSLSISSVALLLGNV